MIAEVYIHILIKEHEFEGRYCLPCLACNDLQGAELLSPTEHAPPSVMAVALDRPAVDAMISRYFKQDYKYREICAFMELVHGVRLSLDQLKRRLKKMGLNRRLVRSSLDDIEEAIEVGCLEQAYAYSALVVRVCVCVCVRESVIII